MALSKEHRIFSRSFSQADASNDDNVIRNVSLITKGEAIGHDCQIDDETISGLFEAAKAFKNGVRCNLGHFTGMENCFGYATNLRKTDDKLIGDLNLFQEHKDFSLIKKQIATIPDTFGFSLFFDGPDEEIEQEVHGSKVKIAFARCTKLMSADLVDCPAANASGVFHRGFMDGSTARGQVDDSTVDSKKEVMADDSTKETPDFKKDINDLLAKHAEHMSKMNDRMDEMCQKIESIGTNDTPVKDDKSAADLEKEQGKVKDSTPDNPGGSAMESDADEEKKDDKIEKKDMSAKPSTTSHALSDKDRTAISNDLMNGLLKAFASQKISPPASATAGSATDGASNGKHAFKTYHEACRHELSSIKDSLTPKTDAMHNAAEKYPELYKAYTRGQTALSRGEGGEWTKEAIFMTPEKNQRRLSIIAGGGRLT